MRNNFTPYPWILNAISKRVQTQKTGQKDFLANCCPGSGKTVFGVLAAEQDLKANKAQFVIICTPSTAVNAQWIKKFHEVSNVQISGSDKNPWRPGKNGEFTIPDGFQGATLTYSALGIHFEELKKFAEKVPVVVIFDENHHLGLTLSWGNAAQAAFENAAQRLHLSGTVFRADVKIPFIRYGFNKEGKEVSQHDFAYKYSDAVRDKICRMMSFPNYGGVVKGKYGSDNFEYDFKDELTDRQSAVRLRACLSKDDDKNLPDFLQNILEEANEHLSFVRQSQPNAGGLVVAMDHKHAKKIKYFLESLGETPELIISENGVGQLEIEKFAKSNHRWCVSVQMITEGVDIPRLRVGVYATNITSWLRFLQIIGRFARHQKIDQPNDTSWLYIPKDPNIWGMAGKILEEVEVGLDERKKKDGDNDNDGDGNDRKTLETTDSESRHDGNTISGLNLTAAEINFAKSLIKNIGLKGVTPESFAMEIRRAKTETETGTQRVVVPVVESENDSESSIPRQYQYDKIRKECGKLVKKLVVAKYGETTNFDDWKKYTIEVEVAWQNLGFPNVKESSVEDLEKKHRWLQEQLRRYKKKE